MKEMRHLGAYGLIINDNKMALIRKSRGAYTGKLDLPGGTIEHGERPIETLVREIKEELDSDVKKLWFIWCRISCSWLDLWRRIIKYASYWNIL